MGDPFELALDSAATWRLVRLLMRDEITEDIRTAFIEWTLRNDHRKLRYLAQCPHCLSPYCALFVLGLRRVRGGRALRNLLALAGVVSMLYEIEPKATET